MNTELIKEFREQAWSLIENEQRIKGELYETREQWERCDQKFAELIVLACVASLRDEMERLDTIPRREVAAQTMQTAQVLIKNRFGVEE